MEDPSRNGGTADRDLGLAFDRGPALPKASGFLVWLHTRQASDRLLAASSFRKTKGVARTPFVRRARRRVRGHFLTTNGGRRPPTLSAQRGASECVLRSARAMTVSTDSLSEAAWPSQEGPSP